MPSSRVVPTIFIGKWTVVILSTLREGPHRPGKLRRRLGGISQRILTRTLRNLESTGLVARCVTASKSPAVEYSLTPMGKSFVTPLAGICRWAYRHNRELIATVRLMPN